MNQLPLSMTVSHGDGETPASFCSRNALLLGRTARDFSLDLGFNFQQVVDGDLTALETLAYRCRTDAGRLLATATARVGESNYTIADQAVTRATLRRRTVRVCPHCLLNDMETGRGPTHTRPYGRLTWQLEPIRTCGEHGIGLVTVSTERSAECLHDFAMLVQPSLLGLVRLGEEAPRRRLSLLESHLAERLRSNGTSNGLWLSSVPFYAAANSCEIFGAVANHGVMVNTKTLSDAEWQEAGNAGYDIVASGEASIRSFLTLLQRDFAYAKGAWGAQSVFGRIHSLLSATRSDPAYEVFRDIVYRHVVETMPVGPGNSLFGRDVTERRLHSVRSASLETGAHAKRLRKLLHAAGYISTEDLALSDERILFEAAPAREFLERVSGTMSLKKTAKYLNAPPLHARLLFETGVIQPFMKGGTDTLKDHAFAKQDLDVFMERLRATATELKADETSFLSIPAASKKASCSAMEIVELILDGKVSKVRLRPGELGYLSVEVDPEEIKPLVRLEDDGSVTLREVERKLKTSTDTVKGLIKHGCLPSKVRVNPVNRCPQTVVPKEELDRFAKQYASLHGLAKENGLNISAVAARLRSAGAVPAFDGRALSATFYERAVAAKCFDPIK